MEYCEEEQEEWRDLLMTSSGLLLGFRPQNCGDDSIDGIFSENGSPGCNGVEYLSRFDWEGTSSNSGYNEFNSSNMDHADLSRTGASIAVRRAVKCGFNASKICYPQYRCGSMLLSPGDSLSPGISPQTKLDSPTLLQNSQLSPTTGTFASRPLDRDSQRSVFASAPVDTDKGNAAGTAIFKRHTEATSVACTHDVKNQVSSTGGLAKRLVPNFNSESLTSVHSSLGFEFPVRFCKEVGVENHEGSPPDRKILDRPTVNSNSSTFQPCDSIVVACPQRPHENGPSMGDVSRIHDSLEGDQNEIYPHTGTARTTEDGYNWRKYGQKQVKGSEYPRSYYKCTHPNCLVKKKVERSHDGQITEIIYKGAHNHSKPQPSRKSTLGSSLPLNEISDIGDGNGSCIKADSGSVWKNIRPVSDVAPGCRIDGLERTPTTSVVTEVPDPLSTTQGKPMGLLESAGTPEYSSAMASHEDDEDAATQGSYLARDDGNEPDLKRRKKDACFVETNLGSRAVREPRVVLQIESEVDILDDGYRWRKYGQKVVKGNPNPRSYYKCTATGCTVRKHVERSSQSKKYVITTYEGKHNHEVPAARNSGHANSGCGSLPVAATNTQTALTLPRNSHLPKPEPHGQDLPLHFDTKMDCSNNFLRPNFLGNLGSPFYPMKFPSLPNSTPYGSFDFSTQHPAYASNMMPALPNLPFPPPLGFPHSVSSYRKPDILHPSVQPMYAANAGPQVEQSDISLLRPKLERRDDLFLETDIHNIDRTKASSSVYNHVTGTSES